MSKQKTVSIFFLPRFLKRILIQLACIAVRLLSLLGCALSVSAGKKTLRKFNMHKFHFIAQPKRRARESFGVRRPERAVNVRNVEHEIENSLPHTSSTLLLL